VSYVLSVDDRNRWSVFDTSTALGTFDTWAKADKFRKSLQPKQSKDDTAPAWTPKSGGY
jgi:hypothetical protein